MKNSFVSKNDFFIRGLVFSWAWHIFWVFLVVPTANDGGARFPVSRSAFLGSILQKEDVVLLPSGARPGLKAVSSGQDRARGDYFSKREEMQKPKAVVLAQGFSKKDMVGQVPRAIASSRRSGDLVEVGLRDYSRIMGHIDFNELKRVSEREDISSFIDFSVVMGAGGLVKEIKKRSGSGDPALEFYIMRKLKAAVFREAFLRGERFILRFKIKE